MDFLIALMQNVSSRPRMDILAIASKIISNWAKCSFLRWTRLYFPTSPASVGHQAYLQELLTYFEIFVVRIPENWVWKHILLLKCWQTIHFIEYIQKLVIMSLVFEVQPHVTTVQPKESGVHYQLTRPVLSNVLYSTWLPESLSTTTTSNICQISSFRLFRHEYSAFEKVNFKCEGQNYMLIGPSEAVCLSTGSFNIQKSPLCRIPECSQMIVVGILTFEKFVPSSITNQSWIPGTLVRFACPPNYDLHGNKDFTCRFNEENTPVWDPDVCLPHCLPSNKRKQYLNISLIQ